MRVTSFALSLAVVLFCGHPSLRAADDNRQGEGKPIFNAQMLRISDLNVPSGNPAGQQLGPTFSPNGTDPHLDQHGHEVLPSRQPAGGHLHRQRHGFRGGAHSFSDLVVGRRVEVKGRVGSDGKLTAREVELGGEGSEPPRGRGRH